VRTERAWSRNHNGDVRWPARRWQRGRFCLRHGGDHPGDPDRCYRCCCPLASAAADDGFLVPTPAELTIGLATNRNAVDDTAPAADESAPPADAIRFAAHHGTLSRGPIVWREVIAGARLRGPGVGRGLLLASEEEERPPSEDGAAKLVRLVSQRRSPRYAGSSGTSNVACRGRTPDLTTAIQTVVKSGVEAGRTGADTRITDLPFGEAAPPATEGPRTPPGSTGSGAGGGGVSGGFHNASIEPRNGSWDYGDDLQKVPLSRYFASGANGIRTRDLLLAKSQRDDLAAGQMPI